LNRLVVITLTALLCLPACNRAPISGDVRYIVWGGPGSRSGQFRYPRAIGVRADEVYVIDMTGRVQVFGVDGSFRRSWSTPASEKGTPTAIAFHGEDRVVVPDTHYSRILEYTPDGHLLDQWGSYGTGPDQFIYPTGIAWTSDGAQYISEYGMGAERVHVFDADREFLRQWGEHGEDEGQLNRAMAVAVDGEDTVYVVDSANHRVQCFDRAGTLLHVIGRVGTGPGELKFPYDLALGPDGSVFVCEYGNHRISRFSRSGEFIACYGRPGREPGEFNGPRGVAVSNDGFVFVADTDNHRVQQFEVEELP